MWEKLRSQYYKIKKANNNTVLVLLSSFGTIPSIRTSSTVKRPRVDRDLMDTLNRMSESTTTIEKIRIEAALAMHKDNLLDCQKNRHIELETFKMQQAENEKLATLFTNVVMQ